ncbi:histone deacetylase [Candidatus Bathyarchaeota archaeon]|nr:histone deacetylase [Candidatus Bathyarchaeota archaeon]
MTKTAVVFSPKYYQHKTGHGHPESAKRLGTIINELRKGKLSKSKCWQFVAPEKARIQDVELVHNIEYIKFIETFCRSGGGLLDLEDTMVSPESFEVALYAVGGTLKAVDLVMERKFENAFALVRPPGHHAEKFRALGFCIFNNVAIAAQHLLKKYGLERIAILDIDAHHGNGTQQVFYETDKVLCVSLHQDPRIFPGTGFIDDIGEGKGLGYNVNIPLPFKTGDHIYLKALVEIAGPIIQQYRPQFLLVSAGLDGHYTDPVASLSLSVSAYQKVYRTIVGLAFRVCRKRLVSVLEGGYSLKFVGKIAAVAIAEMCSTVYSASDNVPLMSKCSIRRGEEILAKVKEIHSAFWNI